MFKKVILIIAAALAALVLILVVVIAVQPAEFHMERNATVGASPEVVFDYVDDFRGWETWSPWAELDPDATGTYSGADRGEGATFEWAGNSEVGAGRMTIVESRPHEYIEINLEFFEPYESSSTTAFTFTEGAEGTTDVNWSMHFDNNFMSKAVGLFMNLEEHVGGDYERGLQRLDEAVQRRAEF